MSRKIEEKGVKNRELWRMHCEKLVEYDEQLRTKEKAIAVLEKQLAALEIATGEHGVMELHTVPGHSASRKRLVAADLPSPHGSDRI